MGENELDDLLRQLHTRLGAAHSLDAEDRRLLTAVARDIEAVLGKRDVRAPSASGLDALAVKFEADHPALAETLRRLVDVLGKAGI
jgi:predicted component of type VI protein secretion system